MIDEHDFFEEKCGRLGGSAVLQAFGRAAYNLLPGKELDDYYPPGVVKVKQHWRNFVETRSK
jgi:hypothetical protein